MSKISRIRILNLNYNNNTIKIDDETFDLGGQNTLISLRNGGGKSVLVQMIVSLFVNRTFRDFGDRPFKSYFTTNRPTFLMTEWQLDNGRDRFLAGMMVRKNQKEDNDAEALEMYTFTGSYSHACKYDLDNIPVVRQDGNRKILKGFSECKTLMEDLCKKETGDFRLYDMTSQYGRRQYFATLRQYQINNKEWESIIRKVNQKESGLSELFQNAKDEKDLVENWFLRPIEEKLNQEKNKIDEFRKLSFQFVEQYRSNQSKIQRKGMIERYFEDTKPLQQEIEDYMQTDQTAVNLRTEMILYVKALQAETVGLDEKIAAVQEKLEQIRKEQERIVYEQLSCKIYDYEDQKAGLVAERVDQEQEVIRLAGVKDSLQRKLLTCELNRLYQELRKFEMRKAEVDEKIQALLQKTEDSREEIETIGHQLHQWYTQETERWNVKRAAEEEAYRNASEKEQNAVDEQKKNEQQLFSLSGKIGGLKSQIKHYDETEEAFNREFDAGIHRNILGFYEEGFLEIRKKEMAAELLNQKNQLARSSGKKNDLEQILNNLAQESSDTDLKIHDRTYQIQQTQQKLTDLEQQKNVRLKIMKYVGMEESKIDQKVQILDQLDGKIRELDTARNGLLQKIAEQDKHFRQLKEGKTSELPANIRAYMEQNGIDLVYGMEWLARNERTVQENTELVKKNPFLPYAVLMERDVFERFRKNEEELYTSFPIPIMIKEELESAETTGNEKIATFGNVHFYVMFNTHLLDPDELEEILKEIRQSMDLLRKFVEEKEADLRTYRDYRSVTEQQTFSTELYQKTENELETQKEQRLKLEKRLSEIRQERKDYEEEKKQIEKLLETLKKTILQMETRERRFEMLCEKYEQYETDRASLLRLEQDQEQLTGRQNTLMASIEELREQKAGLQMQIRDCQEQVTSFQKKVEKFANYAETDVLKQEEITDPARLEARYRALTEEISKSIKEFQGDQEWLQDTIHKKKEDLDRKNEDGRIPASAYENLIFSEEQYDNWTRQRKQAEKEWNRASEAHVTLERKIESCETSIRFCMEDLKKQTGFEEPAERKTITDTEFEKRLNLRKHDFKVLEKEQNELKKRNEKLSIQAAGVEEYADESLPLENEEELTAIREHIPDIRTEEIDTIKEYQKEIRKKITGISKSLENCRMNLSELIRDMASRKEYADDYFKKTFDSLLSQTGNPQNLKQQFEMNRMAYENQLEKLKIDLAHIDDEQKNLEMMFLEYVEQINANIGMIDRNSTITVRGRNLKMLRIQVPDWETEKEHFRLKLHDYFEHVVKMGIETIEKNGNLTEFLGRIITTRKLYDDIVGIQNVKIKLYKIEAEREVPISWSEVSANSGGEGFLSAFVILTCLLSYMRRDETDLFSSGEEGKVLIMDNPFAQTNAEHLLKPLMEMAKKTNTQLICLSGLGGDSIYNRFDNIYVVKLLESSIRNGVQRVEATHMKGEEVKRLVLSDFKMEQVSLFDFMEE